jgi:hypothetical protein
MPSLQRADPAAAALKLRNFMRRPPPIIAALKT